MRKATKKNNVTLREKELASGNISLYLDIYRDGDRKYEFLKLYLNPKARTPIRKRAEPKNKAVSGGNTRKKRNRAKYLSFWTERR